MAEPTPVFQPDLLDRLFRNRVVGNLTGGVLRAGTFPVGLKAFYDTVTGQQDTWAQTANKRIDDIVARQTGVPNEQRTLVDEGISALGPAGIITKPIQYGGKFVSGLLNILNPTTVSGPGVGLRVGLNTAVPTGILAGVDTALGGDIVQRTGAELDALGEAVLGTAVAPAEGSTPAVPTALWEPLDATSPPPPLPPPPAPPVAPPPAVPAAPFEGIPSATWEPFDAGQTNPTPGTSPQTSNFVKAAVIIGGTLAGAKAAGAISRAYQQPGKIDLATRAYGNVFSSDAVIESALQRSGASAADVDKVRSVLHLTGNETPRNTIVRHMFETGTLDGYGNINVFHNGKPQTISGYFNEFASAPADLQEKVRRALLVGTELDNRNRGLAHVMQDGTGALHSEFRAALQDTNVKSFLDRYQQFNHQARDYLVSSGLLTRQEANRLATQNPRYVSYEWANVLAKRENFLNPDSMPAPMDLANTDPMRGMASYWADVIREAGKNNARRQVMNKLVGVNRPGEFIATDVNGAQRITNTAPTTLWEKARTVSWRDGGRDYYAVMSDPALAAAIRKEPVIGGKIMQALNSMRHIEQSLITGTGATVLGAPFAVTSAIMSGTIGSLTRPAGTSMGMIDNALQKYFGVGVRGDPTWTLQAIGAFAQDITAQGKLALARALSRSLDTDGWIANTFGKPFTRNLANNMLREYEGSSLASMRKLGAAHTSLHGVADESFGAGIGGATNYLKSVAPGVTHPHAAPILKAKAALETVLELIGSSANSAFMKQNKGRLPEQQLASAARRLSGDPAEIGSGKFVQAFSTTVPYANTAIQGARVITDAAMSTPAAMAGGAMVAFGAAPYLYQTYIASLPQEYKDYYWNKLTPADRAGKVYAFLPHIPPEQAPSFAIPNELAALFSTSNRMFGDLLGVTAPGDSVVGDEAKKRSENADDQDLLAATSRVMPGQIPMVGRLALAAGGVDTSGFLRFEGNAPGLRTVGGPSIAGTRERPDTIIDGVLGSYYENIINQIPVLGTAMLDVYKSMMTGEGFSGFMERRGMAAADRMSFARPFWGVDQRLSASTADSTLLDKRVSKVNEMIGELRDRARPNALMENGVVLRGINPAAIDPQTRMQFSRIEGAFNALNGKGGVLAQRKTEFSNLTRIDSSNLSPQEKREVKNETVERINALTARALDDISRINAMISDIDKLIPNRNIDGTRFGAGRSREPLQ